MDVWLVRPGRVVSGAGLKEMPELRGFVIWGCPNLVSLPEYLFHRNTKLEALILPPPQGGAPQ